jgi:hypothetical protein
MENEDHRMSTRNSSSISNKKDCEVALFWDYENVPLPHTATPAEAAKAMQSMVQSHLGLQRIEMRRVYLDPSKQHGHRGPRDPSKFDSSGFDLVYTPTRNGTKETLDKKLIVDVLTFAWDCHTRGRQPCVVLITSDGDYAYTLAKLRDRGVKNIVLYGKDSSTAQILIENAQIALSLERDVLALEAVVPPPIDTIAAQKPEQESFSKRRVSLTSTSGCLPEVELQPPPIKRQRSKHLTESCSLTSSSSSSSWNQGKQTPESVHVFLRQVPKDVILTDLVQSLQGFIASHHALSGDFCPGSSPMKSIQRAIIEFYTSRPEVSFCFAHVQFESPADAAYIIQLSKNKKLVYKGKHLQARYDSKILDDSTVKAWPQQLVYERSDSTPCRSIEEYSPQHRHNAPNTPLEVSYSDDVQEDTHSTAHRCDDNDLDIRELCICIWSLQNNQKLSNIETCWVPYGSIQASFQCAANRQIGNQVSNKIVNSRIKAMRDLAIDKGLIETARSRQKSNGNGENPTSPVYVLIKLGEKMSRGLSREFYVRLTPRGQAKLADIWTAQVDGLCQSLYYTQNEMERNGRNDECWIAHGSVRFQFPSFLRIYLGDNAVVFRETYRIAVAKNLLELALKPVGDHTYQKLYLNTICGKPNEDHLSERIFPKISPDLFVRLTGDGQAYAKNKLFGHF